MNDAQIIQIARDGLLWLDENGNPRLLRKDKRSGRTVVGRRVRRDVVVRLLDSGDLYRGTNCNHSTMVHPRIIR